jgi:hypothetical protein
MLSYGLPPAFTHDPRLIGIGIFMGDVLQAAGFLYLWFISIRAFLGHRPRLSKFATSLAYILTAVCMLEALHRDLTPPFGAKVADIAGNNLALIYNDTTLTGILYVLDSLALLIMGIYFWSQAKAAPTKAQKAKIRSLGIGMAFITLAFTIPHAFPLEQQLKISTAIFSLFPLSLAIGFIIAHFKKEPVNQTNKL